MKTGLRFIILIIMVIASGILLYMPYSETKQNTIRSLNEKQMLIAQQAAFGISSFFHEQRNMLHHFAIQPDIINLDSEGKTLMKREYRYMAKNIKAITRYDKKGTILYSYPEPEKIVGRNIADQPHVSKILRDHKTNVSDVFMAVQGFPAVAVSEPVFDGDRFKGAVVFLVNFEYLAKTFLEKIKIGKSGYAWMISRDGTMLYAHERQNVGSNVVSIAKLCPHMLEMAKGMEEGNTGTATYKYFPQGVNGPGYINQAVYCPVELFDNFWSIAVATPRSEVYSELSVFYHEMLMAMGVFTLSILFFVYVVIKDYNLAKINTELEERVNREMDKRKEQEKMMLQQARFYSMADTMNAIAHQWRQPLNSVGLCIQDIEETYKINQLSEEYLSETIRLAMEKIYALSETIDDFRDFFAPSEKAAETNVCSVIFGIYNLVKVQYDELRIKFSFVMDGQPAADASDCDSTLYNAVIYPDMLKQVVLSCLQNSKEAIEKRIARFPDQDGCICITVSKDGNDFVIEVKDNGGGVPESLLDRIFDPYFSTKELSIGMGLGLYAAKNIMEEHMGGSIHIENITGGAMTVIRFPGR